MTGASSNAAMTNTLPVIHSAADQKPLLHEVKKRWLGKRSGNKNFSGKWRGPKKFSGNWNSRKKFSGNWNGPKKHFRGKSRKHFYRGPSIYFGLYPRYYYYDDYYYDNDVYYDSDCGTYEEKKRCARKFKSFNWNTCRYTTYSGYKRLCPYVR